MNGMLRDLLVGSSHLTRKIVPDMTYNVFGETLNPPPPTQSTMELCNELVLCGLCDCSAELGMDWRGPGGGPVAGWDGCRSYPGGPTTQMPHAAMNGVVQRRQMTYNAAAAAQAAGATGYGMAVKQEYGRAIPPKYVISLAYLLLCTSPSREGDSKIGSVVRPSVCLSVACLNITRELKGVGSPNLA